MQEKFLKNVLDLLILLIFFSNYAKLL